MVSYCLLKCFLNTVNNSIVFWIRCVAPLLSSEAPCKFFKFREWKNKLVSFLGRMWYFLGEYVVGGDGIGLGSVSRWFLEGLCCSLLESLYFSLVTSYLRIFICSCISVYFVSSLSNVVSLAVFNVCLLWNIFSLFWI